MFESKYDEAQKSEWLSNFKKSNISVRCYSKEIGVPSATFRSWLAKEKSRTSNQFGIVNLVKNNEVEIVGSSEISIKTEKIKIELSKGYNKKMLKKLIEVITDDK